MSDEYTYWGSRRSADELPDLEAGQAGAVAWLTDTETAAVWDGTRWADPDPAEVLPRSQLVAGYWPYVIGNDVAGQYPEVSRDLAEKTSTLNQSHVELRDRLNGFSRPTVNTIMWKGTGADWTQQQVVSPSNARGFMVTCWNSQAFYDVSFAYQRGAGNWVPFIGVGWSTSGPNRPVMQTLGDTSVIFGSDLNTFRGTFLGSWVPSAAAARILPPPADPETLAAARITPADGDPPTYDLAAVVAALADQLAAALARIETLERKP